VAAVWQRGSLRPRQEPRYRCANTGQVTLSEADARSQGRREAAPAAILVLLLFVLLAVESRKEDWQLLGLEWWVWLGVAAPALLLTVDLLLASRGRGLVRTRMAALVLLGLLVLANMVAVGILVASLVTTSTDDLSGGELLFTAFAIWSTNAIVFGVLFWELEAGGPAERMLVPSRTPSDFRFPQDDSSPGEGDWRPHAWDYLYVSLTNSIAFSPTDTMPVSLRAKAVMGLESGIAAVTVLLVAARAVNVLGT
jgi:hypothetical protein